MSLGTIAFNNEVFNLDFMTAEELEVLLENIDKEKIKVRKQIKQIIK